MNLILGGAIAFGIYLAVKRNKKINDIYPTWTGELRSDRGQTTAINWRDFKIIDGNKIRCLGVDEFGDFKIKGTIKIDGSVTFTYKNKKSGSEVNFAGYVVGPNRIAGTWTRGAERGPFEISTESRNFQVERLVTNAPMAYHQYPISFTENRQYVVGVGRDAYGFYKIVGRLNTKDNKFVMEVTYANKTYFVFTLKRKENSTHYEGKYVSTEKHCRGGICTVVGTDMILNQKQHQPVVQNLHPIMNNQFPVQPPAFGQTFPQQPFQNHHQLGFQAPPPTFEHAKIQAQPPAFQGQYPNPRAYQPHQPYGAPLMGQPPADQRTPFDF